MRQKRAWVLSGFLFVVGIFLLKDAEYNLLGAVIGIPLVAEVSQLLGIISLIASFMAFTSGQVLEEIVEAKPTTSQKLRADLEKLRARIESCADPVLKGHLENIYSLTARQFKEHRTNYNFLQGLIYNIEKVEEDADLYWSIRSVNPRRESRDKQHVLKRLVKRQQGLQRREEALKRGDLPQHISQDETGATRIKDLPDFALYAYTPLPGKKSKMVELEVVHYTSHKSHKQIKEFFEKKKKPVLFMDKAGWTYFLAEALPPGLKMNDARRVIGTGEQFYADKVAPRNPEEEIHLRIRVPKERVLVKDGFYTINGGKNKIWVKKYAVAGGITKEDIVGSLESQRYKDRNLLQDQRYKHREKERWK